MLCRLPSLQELLDDVVELKPNIFVSVPRLWNRIYDKVRTRATHHTPHSTRAPPSCVTCRTSITHSF